MQLNTLCHSKWGEILRSVSLELDKQQVQDHLVRVIQSTFPKPKGEALGEVLSLRSFCLNYAGDNIKFMMRGFVQPGESTNSTTTGIRFPLGATAVISPFNFPLKLGALQFLGSVIVGNFCLLKPASKVAPVLDEFIRLLLHCGMPSDCFALVHCSGAEIERVLLNSGIQMIQFTGSAAIASRLCEVFKGKVKIEDAGFNPKILGPDIPRELFHRVCKQSDNDAYNLSGQKCSAQSLLAIHENLLDTDRDISQCSIIKLLKEYASARRWDELSIIPLLGVSKEEAEHHVQFLREKCGRLGGRWLFGGVLRDEKDPESLEGQLKPPSTVEEDKIPEKMTIMTPGAAYFPLDVLGCNSKGKPILQELFAPIQIVTIYNDDTLDELLAMLNDLDHHLALGVVSQDSRFINKVFGCTIHGVVYSGFDGRTTGAPTSHAFGPGGDIRAAGIGTREGILNTWTGHREFIKEDI